MQAIFDLTRFEPGSSAPLYIQVKKLVREAVTAGDLKEGDAIPGERDVAELLHVSRVTVRKAFSELVAEGVLVQRRGSGTYVNGKSRRIEQPLSRLTSFTQDMQLRGLKTDADWLDRSVGLPTPEEALKLSISPGELVSRFHRLRRADGVPMAIELAVIPQHFLPEPKAVEGSLYAALEARGVRPVRALQRLHATALNAREAELLDLPDGSPALFIERISYLPDGRIVEYTRSHYRGDSYDFVAELTIAAGAPA
ncbi:MAG: GntR family transcriptional regulator [Rhizobiales bacterium]|nr:GntR family transcriptional regulator [Hyphomicrobiales bacterium]MBI3673040.1 GntR family transcriptional regulator [Hyphomicrobiales bacterium]